MPTAVDGGFGKLFKHGARVAEGELEDERHAPRELAQRRDRLAEHCPLRARKGSLSTTSAQPAPE